VKQRTGARRASDKDTRVLLKEAVQRGWAVSGGGTRHYRMACPNPCKCLRILSASGSDRNVMARVRARLNNQTCWKDTDQT
jgi:hypothetical protein